MSDYRDLIEQPSTDRMDVIVYGAFTADNRLGEVVSEKEYMETEGRFGVQIAALMAATSDSSISTEDAARAMVSIAAPDSFAASLDRLGQSVDTFRAVLADEIHSYLMTLGELINER